MHAASDNDAVALFIAQYRQCVELRYLSFPPSDVLIGPDVQLLLYSEMFDDASTQYLPFESYRGRVLKVLLQKLEEAIKDPEEDEVLESFYFYWGDLISKPSPSQSQELSHVRYTMPFCPRPSDEEGAASGDEHGHEAGDGDDISSRSVITLENRSLLFASGTTGFRTWEASLHLATYLTGDATTSTGKSRVAGKSIIDLGCGAGFLSMYCAKCLGAKFVAATDMQVPLIDLVRGCLVMNDIAKPKITAAPWEWGGELPRLGSGIQGGEETSNPTFDIGIGADLTYDPDIIPPLMCALHDLFRVYRIQEFLLSSTIRNEDTFAQFLTACASNHFSVEIVDFQSPPREAQTGLFHSTDIPIHTYRITPQ